MPAKDKYHEAVRNALTKDGWTITHDPLRLTWGIKDMYIDLGAERILGAEKAGQKIAVEIKTFGSQSAIHDLEQALGHFLLYRTVLQERESERVLYLAVPLEALTDVFQEPLGELLIQKGSVRVIGFEPFQEEIVSWTS